MKPTEEQEHIKSLAALGGNLVVRAFAGAGKTTTQAMIAEVHPAKRMIYLAFNKPIADDAAKKMPRKVLCKTTHAIAFAAMRPPQARLGQSLTGQLIAQRYNIAPMHIGHNKKLMPAQLGYLALGTMTNFCNSADDYITPDHVPWLTYIINTVPKDVMDDKQTWHEIKQSTYIIACHLWEEQENPHSTMPLTHDAYFKQWALRRPLLNADLLFFDEAQDASPVMLKVMNEQQANIVWVGDPHQQIYAWRGAVDAMESVKNAHEAALTESFRFGPDIAAYANVVLRQLGESRELIGAGNGQISENRTAYLTRKNATAIGEFIRLMDKKKEKTTIELLGAGEMLTTLKQIQSLQDGRPIGNFSLFANYKELKDYSNTPAGRDQKALIDAVEKYTTKRLITEFEKASSVKNGDITISTIHKAKGREWDNVIMTNDFPTQDDVPVIDRDDENRLMYVGLTRARCNLNADAVLPWLHAMQEAHEPPDVTNGEASKGLAHVVSTVQSPATPAPATETAEAAPPVMPAMRPVIKKRIQAIAHQLHMTEHDALNRVLETGCEMMEKILKRLNDPH